MKHLATFTEFSNSQSETPNYRIPFAAVEPPPNDKGWNYIKMKFGKAPNWGHRFLNQEQENNIKRANIES